LNFLLQLRNELWKLFGKKRTYIGFGICLLTQNIVSIVFRFTKASNFMERLLEGNGYLVEPYISTLTIATVMLFPIAAFLLPLYVSLVGGDLLAKEAEDGTLRMILARPISRSRLIFLKWLAGTIFSGLLVATLGVFGLVFARLWFRWGGLFVWIPDQNIFGIFDSAEGLRAYCIAHVMLVSEAISIMSASFMFGCFNVKPAAATILALSVVFVNFILQNIPYFRDFQNWFFTYHMNLWQFMFAQPIPWWRVGASMSVLFGFNLTFLLIGITAFQVRDIKS
jgi:ABC-2 type transport system permease protein